MCIRDRSRFSDGGSVPKYGIEPARTALKTVGTLHPKPRGHRAVLMLELPDLDLLAIYGPQSLVSVDEPFSVFRSSRHSHVPFLRYLPFKFNSSSSSPFRTTSMRALR